jgi:hypothetical protein
MAGGVQNYFRRVGERIKSYARGRRGTAFYISHDAGGLRVTSLNMGNEFGEAACRWEQVAAVVTYKRDLFAYERIQLHLRLADGRAVELHEGMTGWAALVDKLPEYLPGMRPFAEWRDAAAFPAFLPNAKLLYARPRPGNS